MTARFKALGVIAGGFLWFACMFVAILTPEDSTVGWVALWIWIAPIAGIILYGLGRGVYELYHVLVETFES